MVQTVKEAEQIILAQARDYGNEVISFELAEGRVLACDIFADRNLPPYNRSTMDGIAISYSAFERGVRSFRVIATMAAGDAPVDVNSDNECVEIMTGAAVPPSADTIVRYEDIEIENSIATITIGTLRKGQNIHPAGKDKMQGDIVVKAPCYVDAAVISMAASVGQTQLTVKKLPGVVIITTGDELVEVDVQPSPYQIRKSNSYTIKAVLHEHGINADAIHINDDLAITKDKIRECLRQYDVIMLSGGISMGKFDYVPRALEELEVTKLFHKVQQRPGKPFWFGRHVESDTTVFAFPGNPVSGFLCLHRYFLPWLETSLGVAPQSKAYALLGEDVTFTPPLQYFMQVKLALNNNAQLTATPVEGNGSGDFANLLEANAFMELPAEQSNFAKGAIYPIWPFKRMI